MANTTGTFLRRSSALMVIAVTALAATGCGADSSAPAASAGSGEPQTIRIAVQAIADFAPIWLGVEQGYFEEQGIDVEIVEGGASSAAQVPLLLSGAADIAATTAGAALQASAQKLDVSIIAGLTTFATEDDLDQSGLVVAAGSEITDYAGLEGKTVAISGLKSITEAVVSAAVEEQGGDASAVSFIQAPMPTLGDMVSTGGADAAFLIDPFLSLAVSSGLEVLGHPFPLVAPGVPGTSLVSTSAYAKANPELIEKFRVALEKAAAYATDNPEAVTKTLSTEAKVPMEMLTGSKNPTFNSVVDAEQLKVESDLLERFGALDGTVDTTALVLAN